MRLLTLLAFAVAVSASAQTTWKNLQFGQPRDAVRAQLHAQGIEAEVSQDNALQSTSDYELALPGLLHPIPMHANFHFNEGGGLADVSLGLDLPAMRRYWAALGPDEALFNFAAENLIVSLSGRYGAPLYRSPDCDNDPKAANTFCMLSWRGPEQTVQIERIFGARGPRLVIRYQPLAADL